MAKQQKRKSNNFLSTIYLIILFLTGITVGLTLQTGNNINKRQIKVRTNTESRQPHSVQSSVDTNKGVSQEKQYVRKEQPKADRKSDDTVVQKLENELVTLLVSNGIIQQDIVTQYAKEIQNNNDIYTQYYKEIVVPNNKRIDTFEYQFKTLARNCKIEVSKVVDDNFGKVTYSFYDKDKIYSIVVLKKS